MAIILLVARVEEIKPPLRPLQMLRLAVKAVGCCVVQHISGRADEVAAMRVKAVAIIEKAAMKSALWRKDARFIKGECRLYMRV